MKRYRSGSDPYIVQVTDNSWNNFIRKIEEQTGMKVDSAYRRRYDQWITLYDENGVAYDAEITRYSDGTYEFRTDNMSISASTNVSSKKSIRASETDNTPYGMIAEINQLIRKANNLLDNASDDWQAGKIKNCISHLQAAVKYLKG